jgi:copper chaperone
MTRLFVPDISCGHCKAAVEAALIAVPNAGPVTVDLALREVEVTGNAPAAALIAALARAGYPATLKA